MADRPIRCGARSAVASSRSNERARCAPRLVPASAWISSRIDPAHGPQGLARVRGQDEVERLRGGHEDVGRLAPKGAAFRRRRVAGAHAHPYVMGGPSQAFGSQADAGQWRAQVAVYVVDQGLERGNVEHAQPGRRVARRFLRQQPVEAPEERGQRLAAAGGRTDERVLTRGDGRPTLRLRVRGAGERLGEPRSGRRFERGERVRRNGPR